MLKATFLEAQLEHFPFNRSSKFRIIYKLNNKTRFLLVMFTKTNKKKKAILITYSHTTKTTLLCQFTNKITSSVLTPFSQIICSLTCLKARLIFTETHSLPNKGSNRMDSIWTLQRNKNSSNKCGNSKSKAINTSSNSSKLDKCRHSFKMINRTSNQED